MKTEIKVPTTFGARLMTLMKGKGIPEKGGARALVKAMFEAGIIGDTANLGYTKDLGEAEYKEAVRKYIDSTKTSVQKHLKAETASQLSGEWLTRYCEFFGCSADYLFGIIDSPTHELTDIVKHTGLSERAINVLHGMKEQECRQLKANKHCVDMVSELLECIKESPDNNHVPISRDSIFTAMYDYIYNDSKVVDTEKGEIEYVMYGNENDSKIIDAKDLCDRYVKEQIDMKIEWLKERRKEKSNGNHH